MEFDADVLFFLGASVVVAFYFSFRFLRHTRLIEDTPTSKVRSASQGYVELEGISRTLDDNTIIAPLTQTSCVWWFYEIEKKVSRGKNTSWDTIDKKTSDTPFYLEDNTGQCVVNPVGAEVVTTLKHVWYGNNSWPSTGPAAKSAFFNLGGRYRFTERLILPGSQVYALGLFKTLSGELDANELQVALREKLAEWKQDPERMKLFDVDKDGEVDVKEWEAARKVALRQLQRGLQTKASDGLHTMQKPELKSQPYLLSTVLQKDLCQRWRWYAGLCFAWFLVGGVVFVWQLIEWGLLGD